MRNIFINDYRRKIKQNTFLDNSSNDYLLHQRQGLVGNLAEGKIREKEIRQAIEDLPEIFRIPFLLYFEGYKYHEIANKLNEPLGTIKSRIHFARKLLKERISRY
jgi:RNA polymerase sigma-70 factor (ECF subfamily)